MHLVEIASNQCLTVCEIGKCDWAQIVENRAQSLSLQRIHEHSRFTKSWQSFYRHHSSIEVMNHHQVWVTKQNYEIQWVCLTSLMLDGFNVAEPYAMDLKRWCTGFRTHYHPAQPLLGQIYCWVRWCRLSQYLQSTQLYTQVIEELSCVKGGG